MKRALKVQTFRRYFKYHIKIRELSKIYQYRLFVEHGLFQ